MPGQLTLRSIQGGNATALHWTFPDEGKNVLRTFVVEVFDASLSGGAFRQLVGEGLIATAWLHHHGPEGTGSTRSVLGSWVGVRHPFPPFLVPNRSPHGFTQDPSTDRACPGPDASKPITEGEAALAS